MGWWIVRSHPALCAEPYRLTVHDHLLCGWSWIPVALWVAGCTLCGGEVVC